MKSEHVLFFVAAIALLLSSSAKDWSTKSTDEKSNHKFEGQITNSIKIDSLSELDLSVTEIALENEALLELINTNIGFAVEQCKYMDKLLDYGTKIFPKTSDKNGILNLKAKLQTQLK